MKVIVAKGKNLVKRTFLALKELNPKIPPNSSKILIKPNLVEPLERNSGAITRPEIIEGIIKFFGTDNFEIIIAEGSATDTLESFEKAGYFELREKYGIKLVDLNKGNFVKVNGNFWKFEINELAKKVDYKISAAVLKEHSFEVTLSIKNLMGFLKPQATYPFKAYMHEEGSYEIWTSRMIDLFKAIKPNLAVIDATTAMFHSHLFGKLKELNLTIASEDLLAADLYASTLLGKRKVYYLEKMLELNLGNLPEVKILE